MPNSRKITSEECTRRNCHRSRDSQWCAIIEFYCRHFLDSQLAFFWAQYDAEVRFLIHALPGRITKYPWTTDVTHRISGLCIGIHSCVIDGLQNILLEFLPYCNNVSTSLTLTPLWSNSQTADPCNLADSSENWRSPYRVFECSFHRLSKDCVSLPSPSITAGLRRPTGCGRATVVRDRFSYGREGTDGDSMATVIRPCTICFATCIHSVSMKNYTFAE